MDISDTLAPNSDQLDAIELAGGPRTFTIERVSAGNAEQPVQIHFTDFPRPWRPAKSMRRVLAACWGTDASLYAGRRVTLFFDPDVTFGKDKPGGTRIRALSHIDGRKSVPLLVSRGKSAMFTVEPLKVDATPAPVVDSFAAMLAALKTAGLDDKDDALATIREITGRDIVNPRADLTPDETQTIIDTLGAVTGAGAA